MIPWKNPKTCPTMYTALYNGLYINSDNADDDLSSEEDINSVASMVMLLTVSRELENLLK
jgi:hypothetical protein